MYILFMTYKQRVGGSIPSAPTLRIKGLHDVLPFLFGGMSIKNNNNPSHSSTLPFSDCIDPPPFLLMRHFPPFVC